MAGVEIKRLKDQFGSMQKLSLLANFMKRKGPFKALFLGAHSDDIELGCGGTILSLLDQGQELHVSWVVFSSNSERRSEAEKSADMFLNGARTKEVIIK